jgi:hypothetical protein
VLLDGVTISGNTCSAINAGLGSSVQVTNHTSINNSGPTMVSDVVYLDAVLVGAATFVLDNSTVSNSPNVGIRVSTGSSNPGNVTLQNGAAVSNSGWWGVVTDLGNVTLTGATLSQNGITGTSPVSAPLGAVSMGGWQNSSEANNQLTVIGSTLTGNQTGIDIRAGSLKVRSTSITMTKQDAVHWFASTAASTIDLGASAADPGANTLQTNNTSLGAFANVRFEVAGAPTTDRSYNAIGNTWAPLLQNADVNGKYTTPQTFTAPAGGTVSGANVTINNGSGTHNLSLVTD